MAVYTEVRKGVYFDSVTLMLYSGSIKELQGVAEAAVMMGTDHNKRLMADSGVLDAPTADSATPNDLIIGINAESDAVIESAKALLEDLLQKKSAAPPRTPPQRPSQVLSRSLAAPTWQSSPCRASSPQGRL